MFAIVVLVTASVLHFTSCIFLSPFLSTCLHNPKSYSQTVRFAPPYINFPFMYSQAIAKLHNVPFPAYSKVCGEENYLLFDFDDIFFSSLIFILEFVLQGLYSQK